MRGPRGSRGLPRGSEPGEDLCGITSAAGLGYPMTENKKEGRRSGVLHAEGSDEIKTEKWRQKCKQIRNCPCKSSPQQVFGG